MNECDKALLHDIAEINSLGRIGLVRTLQKGISSIEETTMDALDTLYPPEVKNAHLEEDSPKSYKVYTQATLISKIYAEWVAAYEDLGALGWSIMKRETKGIFHNYVESSADNAREFFRWVQAYHGINQRTSSEDMLNGILKIPTLSELIVSIDQELLRRVEQIYLQVPKFLNFAADQYLEQRQNMRKIDMSNASTDVSESDIYIILGIILPNDNATKRANSGIYTSTYNKIKHRYLITTDISAYKPTGADQIEYVKLMKSADELATNTISAIKTMATIADTLLFLDKTGLLV